MTQSALRDRSTAEWVALLDRFDVPHAPVLSRRDMIRHPQIAANALIFEHDHPEAGSLRQTRSPARFTGTPPEHRMGAPVLGQHSAEVLAEAGLTEQEIAEMMASGAARSARTREAAE